MPAKSAKSTQITPLDRKKFGVTMDGLQVDQITLTNGNGAKVGLITYGATVTDLIVPDRRGKLGNVNLGFDSLRQYELQSPFFGAVVGRVGNRIARGLVRALCRLCQAKTEYTASRDSDTRRMGSVMAAWICMKPRSQPAGRSTFSSR